jgi:hypothetical protein
MTKKQMDLERRALGDIAFRQEYLSEFLTPFGALIHAESIGKFMDHPEEQDFTGLELGDLEDIVREQFTTPDVEIGDLRTAVDVADRVSRTFFEG